MTDKYKDPTDGELKLVFELMKNATCNEQIQTIINVTFPDWIVSYTEKYSNDYPSLQSNWETMCKKLDVKPRFIVRVDDIKNDANHLITQVFCERMTREGYVVRRKNELILCEKCSSAIPNFEIYEHMKRNNLPVPDTWSNTCTNCTVCTVGIL